jgi:hypothetical protein
LLLAVTVHLFHVFKSVQMPTAQNNELNLLPHEDRFDYLFNTDEGDGPELALLLSAAIISYMTTIAGDVDFPVKADKLAAFVDRTRRVLVHRPIAHHQSVAV